MKPRKLVTTTVLALALVSACSSSTPEPTQTLAPTLTPTIPPTNTPTATPTFTRRPFIYSTFTPAPTLPPTPTLTPWPTYPPDEALAKVLELFETNAGCQLPCWWGIIPGETPWDVAQNFYLL